jgi:hypothetical protein
MTREEALSKASEHVKAMATNSRGFMDGVNFQMRVSATLQLAEFLLGEESTTDDYSD